MDDQETWVLTPLTGQPREKHARWIHGRRLRAEKVLLSNIGKKQAFLCILLTIWVPFKGNLKGEGVDEFLAVLSKANFKN